LRVNAKYARGFQGSFEFHAFVEEPRKFVFQFVFIATFGTPLHGKSSLDENVRLEMQSYTRMG
jgi:hypothetical protein